MKRVVISFFIMILILTNLSFANINSVQADTTNTIKVSLENIKDIVIENSLEIKIQRNNMQIKKEYYNKAKDTKDKNENAKEDAENKLKNLRNDSTVTEEQIKYAEDTLDAAKKEVKNADDALTETKKAYKDAKIVYDQKVETEVHAAQKAYVNYLYDVSNTMLEEGTVKSFEQKEKLAKIKYESGFLSNKDYISITHDNSDSINKLKELKNVEELSRIKLCNMLGISQKENITFNKDINADFQVIPQINYKNDLKKMLSNNIEIENQNDEIDDLNDKEDDYEDNDQDDIYDYEVKNANIELKKLISDAETQFKEQYNTLINSYNSIKNNYNKILQEQKEYNIMQAKYDYGFVSKTELENSKLAFDKDNANFTNEKNQLYIEYLRYIQMREGY
ncbi:TolC family protein [Clostridium chromiireducens]|uniref:TolC family protein n=1 Tax=Clostridium chromiireducens TaxID=225345 RepID=UPI003AF7158C